MLFESVYGHYLNYLRRNLAIGLQRSRVKVLRHAGLVTFAACLAGSTGCIVLAAEDQKEPTANQEGVQQNYPQMTTEQRAAATRAFLGLGAVPDKAAAARGAPLFVQNCAVCHGKAARGAMGPSLITADRVLTDEHGEGLVPFLKKGSPGKGMPAFSTMSDQELKDVIEFLHLQVENVANRGTYKVLNILVGNATKGKAFVESHCMSCHSTETFMHIASKFRSPEQLQRSWIWPAREGNIIASVKTSGRTISGRIVQISDFHVTLEDKSGELHTIDRGTGIEVQMNDPLVGHQQLVMTLANDDMHDVTAYLETLR